MKLLIKSTALVLVVLGIMSSCNSQDEGLTAFDPNIIALSQEYEDYSKSVQVIAYFLNENEIDFPAVSKAMFDYSATGDSEDYPVEIFEHIPNAMTLHQLSINRSLAKKVVNRKFDYGALSAADRKRVRAAYNLAKPFVLSIAEMEAIIDRIKNQ